MTITYVSLLKEKKVQEMNELIFQKNSLAGRILLIAQLKKVSFSDDTYPSPNVHTDKEESTADGRRDWCSQV